MSAQPVAGGNRRIDRVLHADFLADLESLSMDELRARRQEADQEEVDLSYVRRMLQGRADIALAEKSRRSSSTGADGSADGEAPEVVTRLTEAFGDEPERAPAQGLGRFRTLEPSRVGETRRGEEALIATSGLEDPTGLSDSELDAQLADLANEEQQVSANRKRVQSVLDVLSAELTRRYRDGSASVDALLE